MVIPNSLQCARVNNLFEEISNTSFLDTPIVILSDNNTICSSDIFQCILTFIVTQTTVYVYNIERDMENRIYVPANIVFHGNLTKLNDTQWLWMRTTMKMLFNSHARILVVEESLNSTQPVIKTFYDRMSAVEVTVAVLQDGGFYTWFPYRAPECGNVSTIVRVEQPELFPRKTFHDLQGCTITYVAILNPPYVIDNENGIEMELLRVVSNKLNATARCRELWDARENDVKTIGALLRRNEVDVAFGGVGSKLDAFIALDPVIGHTLDFMIIVCPAPKPISRMVLLVRAFPFEMWCFVFATSLALAIICHLLNGQSSILIALALMMGLPFGNTQLNKLNVFVVSSYFSTICIVAVYQACLYQLLDTVPRERPFQSLEELLASDYTYFLMGHEDTSNYPSPELIKLVNWIPVMELSDGKSYGEVPENMYMYHLQNKSWYYDDFGNPLHTILRETFDEVPLSFTLSPGHPLRDKFSSITLQLIEGGFPNKWSEQLFKPDFTYDTFVNTPIAMIHVEGPFYILFFLNFIALLIFVTEKGVKRLRKGRTLHRQRLHGLRLLLNRKIKVVHRN